MTEWHAVKSRPGAEGRALIGIEACGMTGFLPVELVRKDHRGRRAITWRALFDGYLFARCDPGRDISRLIEIDGVEDVLRQGYKLSRIPDDVIEAIKAAEQAGAFDRTRKTRLAHGDDVQISTGPFGSLVAKIKSARPSRRMELLVNFPFRVTASVDNIEKISA